MLNIIDLFKKEELTETNEGYKTICPECGLQGGRTEGFILFPETNTSYCHSSHKWFTLLQTAALRLGIIKCIEGNDKDDKPEHDEEFEDEIYELIEVQYGKDFLTEFRLSCNDLKEFLIKTTSPKGKISWKVNVDKISSYLIDKNDIKTIYGLKEEVIYLYEDGVWNKTGKGLIKAEIENLLGHWATNNIVSEILEKIKRKTETSIEDFDEVPELKICLLNGVLNIENIKKIEFLPHSKDYNFKSKLPICYNDEANCPGIKKFIEDTFYPDDIPQVQQWFGHHLPKRYLFKKAVIVHGSKNTGKSVFLNLLSSFLGVVNIVDLSLQKISIGKSFDLHFLKDKFGNIHDDLSSKDLNDGGGFKMAVGDGFISGEQKFGDHHRFRNSAKMTFACNRIPPVKDIDDDAYYDRWLVWPLDNVISSKDKDINLISKLSTEEEMSGLLNWAIMGYCNLIKQNKFSNEKGSEEIKELMVENGNPLARFVSEKLLEEVGNKITKEEMYNQYCHFCLSHKPKLSPCSKDQLGKQLNRYAPWVYSSSNGKERYWLNAKLNSCVNMTAITSLKKPYRAKRTGVKEGTYTNNIIFPKASLLSVDKTEKKKRKVSKKGVTKKKTDREIQFWEAEECKNIKPNHTKKDVYLWLKKNPEISYKEFIDKFGVGCLKFRNELLQEEKI